MNKIATIRIILASLTLLCFFLAFHFLELARIFSLQLGPALSRPALGFVAVVLVLTLVFGRFYCSICCPLGILQDFIGFVAEKIALLCKIKPLKKIPLWKNPFIYVISGVALGLLATGDSSWLLRTLDPFANFGKIATGAPVGILLVILFILFQKRIFCTAVCPVGGLLGVLSKRSLFQMRIGDDCTECGVCSSVCPTNAIENCKIDSSQCVMCMNCVQRACKVEYGIVRPRRPVFDSSRRDFIIAFAAAALVPWLINKADAQAIARVAHINQSKCYKCRVCIHLCKAGAIRNDMTVDEKLCKGCGTCAQVCPVKAIVVN